MTIMYSSLLNYWRVCIPLFMSVFCLSSCGDDDEDGTLRSSMDESGYFYSINNTLAAGRLSQIMYGVSDAASAERFKLVHISDAHLSDWSSDNHYTYPLNLIEAVKFSNQPELKINALAATGDHIGYTKKEKAVQFLQSFYYYFYAPGSNDVPSFSCLGNHDSNTMEGNKAEYISRAELNNIFNNYGNYELQTEVGRNYYYADVPNPMGGFVRFIALDMLDQEGSYYDTLFDAVFSQEQINWLGNVALKKDMTSLHSVVILNHYPFQGKWSYFMQNASYVHSWRMVPETIEAFRKKEPLRVSYPSTGKDDSTGDLSVDFDFTDAPGEFICHLGGHIHATVQFPILGLKNQSAALPPQQMLICTNMSPSDTGTTFNTALRTSGSTSSNSFCIYAIDTDEKNIYITYFGAKPSGDAEQPEVVVLPYL